MISNPAYGRLLRAPKSSFFLLGIRGVGKSTWARQHFPRVKTFDLLDEGLYQDLLANPALFADALRAVPHGEWVVVDEIQRLPNLLNEVHRAMEERRLRFALLGSSARKLKTSGTNLLAGRAIWQQMFPLLPEELERDFDLERALQYGSIPLIWGAEDPGATLNAYVQLYLREEIRGEALVRNLPGFVRCLPVAALFHGQILNVTTIARDAAAARTTVNGYVEILEDTLAAVRLAAFEARLRVRERKLPKLYWSDPGLVRAIKRSTGKVLPEERGPLFEGWVFGVLRAYAAYRDLFEEIFYWAPLQARGVEVDFLLRRGRDFIAIEAKSRARFERSQLVGLRAIGDLNHLVRRILVYPGSHELRTAEGIEVWPVPVFLDKVQSGNLWP